MTLELARKGLDVTGLELSPASVEIARKTKDTYGIGDKGGKLDYVNSDFMSYEPEAFDVVCFFLTFHHFENPGEVLEKVTSLLKPGGTIIVVEPARDWFSEQNAIVVTLIRLLLSQFGGWHQELELPKSASEMQSYVTEYLNEYKEAKDKNEAEQSPNDNSSYADHMVAALDKLFDRTDLRAANSLTPRLLGGVRAETEEKMIVLARFLKI
jgi:SAM-dependent methyltransferase